MIRAGLLWLALCGPTLAHGAFTPDENDWLNRQRAVDGTKCCDETDAHVGEDVEWRMRAGRYEVFVLGAWHEIPEGRLMQHRPTDPTPWPGRALLFYSVYGGRLRIWCFFPEPLT